MLLYARSDAVGVVQPDLCMIGGLSEGLRLTAAARRLDRRTPVGIAPHTPFLGPSALASIHLMAALDQVQYFATVEADEAMDPYDIGLTRWQPAVAVPTAPGLGHDPRPDYVKHYAMA
ncbi:MAG: enolase C-terminal domain-like protein [Reyranellaceae bacterium]